MIDNKKRGEGIASPLFYVLLPTAGFHTSKRYSFTTVRPHRPQGFLSPSESGDELRKGPSHRNGLPLSIRGKSPTAEPNITCRE